VPSDAASKLIRPMTVAVLLVVFAALALGGLLLARSLRELLEGRLGGVEEKLDRRLGDLDTKVDRRLEGLDAKLLSSHQSAVNQTTQIVERLTSIDGAAAQMLARANDLARLEQVLRPPKARGGFGELWLENLLRDRLPPSAYEMQYEFKSGERVDAVIRVEKLVPVDSKFPLPNFEAMVDAQDELERQQYSKAFARDVKIHIDSIATKYIKPGEGTYDFAFMYLPVEGIYYELVAGKTGALLEHAHDRRVFPVSPTTFAAYLQVIAIGLKGMEFEQNAHEVMAYCAELRGDFDRFRDDFELVGKHLGHAHGKYQEAEKRLDRVDGKLERAGDFERAEIAPTPLQPELPRAADAA
jgi:DNA recombination protein RmuC